MINCSIKFTDTQTNVFLKYFTSTTLSKQVILCMDCAVLLGFTFAFNMHTSIRFSKTQFVYITLS